LIDLKERNENDRLGIKTEPFNIVKTEDGEEISEKKRDPKQRPN
jgi:hypothetical protein